MNHDETLAYFETKDYYGLGADSFNFFSQGVLPCLSASSSSDPTDYKVILSSPCSIAFAPDGNGGIYNSLSSSGMLKKMKEEGVVSVHCFSVDNVLVKPADPTFIGFCMSIGADVGNKVLWKASPEEKIGVMATDNKGRSCVVEYSDMCDTDKNLRDKSGGLVYGAGNICNHFYTLEFLERLLGAKGGVDSAVTYHIAKKKIPYFDGNKVVKPETPNGIKLETFIFDVFPFSNKMAVLEVQREEEFAPIKNKDDPNGKVVVADSPTVAKEMICALSKRWILSQAKKKKKKVKAALDNLNYCEVAPTISYEGEGITSEIVEEVLKRQRDGEVSVVFE
ncbi:hypothetical protein TrRE_jg8698 [Triparma retinervis]|uniref:UDP-N-acetylglucosamine diphosphorylase n=1 Tax=Triparma retinervis TaxID=2557542 RepID=A0A9W6Z8E4_9STRA|nr:hypothetical protein TrRE_jg8698 [Triparma retinervis]